MGVQDKAADGDSYCSALLRRLPAVL